MQRGQWRAKQDQAVSRPLDVGWWRESVRTADASRLKPCPASWWESRHVSWEHVGPDLELYRSGPTTVHRPAFPI